MSKNKISLRSPGFAALLAFLIPGLGHLYQGRLFKAVIYFVCIMGTFTLGMRVGECKVVYFDWDQGPQGQKTLPYLCQVWVGLPALPALAQVYLRPLSDYEPNNLPRSLTAPCEGNFLEKGQEPVPFIGEVTLTPVENFASQIQGEFRGRLITPKGDVPIEGKIQEVELAGRVAPDPRRQFSGTLVGKATGAAEKPLSGELKGGVPRNWLDRYGAPLLDPDPATQRGARLFVRHPTDLERAHERLGKNFELGVLYTMVAGLLNILAIYDALDGPAYGDEEAEADAAQPAAA